MNNDMHEYITKCILWGQLSLSCEQNTEYVSELFQELTSSEKLSSEDLTAGKDIIFCQARKAMDWLKSDASLYLTESDGDQTGAVPGDIVEEMDSGLAAIVAMRNLDQFLYFTYAIEMMANQKNGERFKIVNDEASELFDEIIWGSDLPLHRLIPLNTLRCAMIENVSKDNRHMFSWYELWSEKAPDTWFQFAHNMAGYSDTKIDADPVLNEVLLNDESFYNRLLREALLINQLPQALEEDVLYHLLREVDEFSSIIPLPDAIVEAGRVDAAIRVAVNDVLAGIDSKTMRIEAALFGMGLNIQEREEILDPLLTEGWTELSGTRLQQQTLRMIDRLKEVAIQGFIRLPECHFVFHKLLTCDQPKVMAGMIKAWDMAGGYGKAALRGLHIIFGLPSTILDKMTSILPDGELQPVIEYALARHQGSDSKEESGKAAFPHEKFPKTPFMMPDVIIEQRRGQKNRYLSIIDEPIMIESQETEPIDLRMVLERFQNLWWGGFAFYDGGCKQLDPAFGYPPYELKLEDDRDYYMLIIFIHPEREELIQALNGIESSENKMGMLTYIKK